MGIQWPDSGGVVPGRFGLGGVITPSQITSNTDNYAPTGYATASIWRLDTDASRNLTGIAALAAGTIITLVNIGSFPIVLKAETTSTEANRFDLANDIAINPKSAAVIYYDGTASRWKMLAAPVLGKRPVWIPAAAWQPRKTNGCAALAKLEMSTNKWCFPYLAFDPSSTEYAEFYWPAIAEWDRGTVTFQYVWAHPSTTTNFGVSFGLAGLSWSNDEAGDAAAGTRVQVVDTGGTTSDIYVSPVSDPVTIAGTPAVADLIGLSLNRKHDEAGDTMAVDAFFIGAIMWMNITSPQAG